MFKGSRPTSHAAASACSLPALMPGRKLTLCSPQPINPSSVSMRTIALRFVELLRKCERYGAMGGMWGTSTTVMWMVLIFIVASTGRVLSAALEFVLYTWNERLACFSGRHTACACYFVLYIASGGAL